ncbi:MAG: polymer-forming cytoskeletal protein [Anaerolineae bacterium]|jgi:cytoskeletal protein CcmA (bactofilin family)|nr:polymer-forming cytoskeletal protein [Anaerolineae bacterium]
MAFFSNRRQQEQPDSSEQEAPRAPAPAPIGFETVLGANSTLEGVLTSSGNVRLDGTFSGTLDINGNVLVGETARITADVDARNISIAGAVRGNVNGNKVQLLRTGRVWGDISATALTTEEGAFIDGRITMKGHAASRVVDDAAESTRPEKGGSHEKTEYRKEEDTQPSPPGAVDLEPTLPLPPFELRPPGPTDLPKDDRP